MKHYSLPPGAPIISLVASVPQATDNNGLQCALTHRQAPLKRLCSPTKTHRITPETQPRRGLAFAFELA